MGRIRLRFHSRRQLLANAFIAASRVGSYPCVARLISPLCPLAHIQGRSCNREVRHCQSAFKFDASSASNFDPFARRGLLVALVSSELAGIAETRRARV